MQRITVALSLLLLSPLAAAAQGFDTALPLDGAERRAVETRLSTILEFSGPNEVSSFTLPSGRQIIVRPYRPARSAGGTPCRGYRIDLQGDRGSVAVDGYRCRGAGQAWVIAEPETVVARAGSIERPIPRAGRARQTIEGELDGEDPFRRRMADALGPQDADEARRPDEALIAGDALPPGPRPVIAAGEAAPVPRRAPLRVAEATSAADDPFPEPLVRDPLVRDPLVLDPLAPEPRVDPPLAPRGPTPLSGLVAEALDRSAAPAPVDEADAELDEAAQPDSRGGLIGASEPGPTPLAPSSVAVAATGIARAPAAAEPVLDAPAVEEAEAPAAETRVAALPLLPSGDPRVVDTREQPASPALDSFDDPRIVDALRNLAYLKEGATPTAAAVQVAVDEFARDEEFALPVGVDDLAARLAEALDRSDRLPRCTPGTSDLLCVASAS